MDKYILLLLVFLAGCTTITGMNEWDKKSQEEGLVLHCTEMIGEKCLTYQWVNAVDADKYRRYHYNATTGEVQ